MSLYKISALKGYYSCKVDVSFWNPLKMPFRSQLINFLQKKYFKKLAKIYYNKFFLWRNLCGVWKKKQHNINFFYFQIACKY